MKERTFTPFLQYYVFCRALFVLFRPTGGMGSWVRLLWTGWRWPSFHELSCRSGSVWCGLADCNTAGCSPAHCSLQWVECVPRWAAGQRCADSATAAGPPTWAAVGRARWGGPQLPGQLVTTSRPSMAFLCPVRIRRNKKKKGESVTAAASCCSSFRSGEFWQSQSFPALGSPGFPMPRLEHLWWWQ